MKKRIVLTLAWLTAWQFYGCKSTAPMGATPPVYHEWINDNSCRKVMKDKELYAATKETIPVDSVHISSDTLHVYTAAIQACDADLLRLIWTGSLTKSIPPQAAFKLLLTSDPTCKEWHRFHLRYNLSPVRLKSDSAAGGTALIRLYGLKDALLYHF